MRSGEKSEIPMWTGCICVIYLRLFSYSHIELENLNFSFVIIHCLMFVLITTVFLNLVCRFMPV